MWCVTVCKGDYRLPICFTSFHDASDFIQSAFASDEYKNIQIVITVDTNAEALDG